VLGFRATENNTNFKHTHTYIYRRQQCNIESVAMEMQRCVLFIAVLHTSLPTVLNTLKSPKKAADSVV
jgi:hypothetical protein